MRKISLFLFIIFIGYGCASVVSKRESSLEIETEGIRYTSEQRDLGAPKVDPNLFPLIQLYNSSRYWQYLNSYLEKYWQAVERGDIVPWLSGSYPGSYGIDPCYYYNLYGQPCPYDSLGMSYKKSEEKK